MARALSPSARPLVGVSTRSLAAEQGAVAQAEAEAAVLLTDEVQHGEAALAGFRRQAQAPAQRLEELRGLADVGGSGGIEGFGGEAGSTEALGHEAGVLDAHAEAKAAHAGRIGELVELGAHVAAAAPLQNGEVGGVGDGEVVEGGDQQLGAQVIEPAPVAGCGGVVKFIHDHHREAIGGDLGEGAVGERLPDRVAPESGEAVTGASAEGAQPASEGAGCWLGPGADALRPDPEIPEGQPRVGLAVGLSPAEPLARQGIR